MASMTDRLDSAVHFVVSTAPTPEQLGATKLNKVLFAADVMYFRKSGQTVTGGDAYVKRQFGPVPKGIAASIERLVSGHKIATRKTPTPAGNRTEFWSLVDPDMRYLTADQTLVLSQAINRVCKLTAFAASEETHDALWESTDMGDDIPIAAAAVQVTEVSLEALSWGKKIAAKLVQHNDLRSAT